MSCPLLLGVLPRRPGPLSLFQVTISSRTGQAAPSESKWMVAEPNRKVGGLLC
jgi:hypothetical protein